MDNIDGFQNYQTDILSGITYGTLYLPSDDYGVPAGWYTYLRVIGTGLGGFEIADRYAQNELYIRNYIHDGIGWDSWHKIYWLLGVGAVKRNAGCRVLYPASIFVQNDSGNTFYLKFKVPETSYSFVNYSFIVSDDYGKFSIINLYVYHTKYGSSIIFTDQRKLVTGTQIASYLNYDANSGLLYIILKLEGFKWTTATLCDIYTHYYSFSNPSIFDTFNYTVKKIDDLPSGSVEFT